MALTLSFYIGEYHKMDLYDSSITSKAVDSHCRVKFCCVFGNKNSLKNPLLTFCDQYLPQTLLFGDIVWYLSLYDFLIQSCACVCYVRFRSCIVVLILTRSKKVPIGILDLFLLFLSRYVSCA